LKTMRSENGNESDAGTDGAATTAKGANKKLEQSLEAPDFPESYGQDRCRIMARDPFWVHAYWEVSEDTLVRAKGELEDHWEDHKRILRVHSMPNEVGGSEATQPPGFFDIEVGEHALSWYIHVGIPSRAYRVDVGVLTDNGLFYPLASSNRVTTPPEKMSEEVAWASIPEEAREAHDVSGSAPVTEVSDASVGSDLPSGGNQTVGLKEQEHRQGTVAEEPPSSRCQPAAPRAPMTPPRAPHKRIAGGPPKAEAPEGGSFVMEQPMQNSSPGAWMTSPGARPTSPGARGAKGQKERDFWFVLDTELIVSGATEPDAHVTIQGVPVQLRPDGTFTVRFQLPDGVQEIPVIAVSRDGISEREITPTVTRDTERRSKDSDSGSDLEHDEAKTDQPTENRPAG